MPPGTPPRPQPHDHTGSPAVIRISALAHLAAGFLALCLLVFVPYLGIWGPVLFIIPIMASGAIARLRTVVDHDTVTVRTLTGSRQMSWDDIAGLRFTRSAWARAHLHNGEEIPLPAVTFAMLPLLTAASGGRVPHPYPQDRA